ncbi:glycoside hydrolase family 97 protein [Caulobacter segnis]|uniref:glycoside hydrolase family 97 protein n=1 Tax=Caulobacter segnis TaxID=88688 RepID=UPI001CBAA188|nr:glycoside hydrolase family 97 protein [Caulobacter segnis]UAL09856.1 glycoside hydrolase family 97 protein [Caulobacter segnis]
MKRSAHFLTALTSVMAFGSVAQVAAAAETVTTSPGGRTEIRISDEGDQANFTLKFKGQALVTPSALGLALDKGGALSRNLKIVGTTTRDVDQTYELVVGKTRTVRDRFAETTVEFLETGGLQRRLKVVARAYDDGVAFRYVLPDQPSLAGVAVRGEETKFALAGDDRCWALNLGRFGTSHEGEYDPIQARDFRAAALYELPVVCQTPETKAKGAAFAIAEADLKNWAGLYLSGREDGGPGLQVKLSPRLDDPSKAVTTRIGTDTVSSWRVVMMGDTPGDLVSSNLMTSLNPPTTLTDTRWIKPGKAAWDWWNGLKADVPDSGMNDATMKRFIDFAAANRLEYMLIDDGWYVGSGQAPRILPGTDVTRSIPAINLPALVAYGRDKGVGIMVWVHWKALDDQMDEALAAYEKLGLKGIKVDFMDRDDQQIVDYYHRLLTKAGEHRLMVDLHGAYRPTGLIRTYPHYVTQEGVMGAEYNKWSARVTAAHNVTLPFTRMLLGPMDYTPGGFRNVRPADFKDQFILPTVQTTRGQALAMYVVYDSPLSMVSDSPLTYAASPAGLDFVSAAPTSWDETRVLSGEIGQSIVIARRKGAEWWVGAMTNETGRTVKVPLDFLGAGTFQADIREDGAEPTTLKTRAQAVTAKQTLSLTLAPSGGGVVRLTPAQ